MRRFIVGVLCICLLPGSIRAGSAPAAIEPNPGASSTQNVQPAEVETARSAEPRGVEVSERGTVRLHVTDQPLSTVLRLLSVQGRRNIITSPAVRGTVTADLYDVPFEDALDAILLANGAGYLVREDFIYVYTLEELAGIREAQAPRAARKTRVFQLYYITAAEAQVAIAPLLSEGGTIVASEPAEGSLVPDPTDAGADSRAINDYLVVHDYPENLTQIERLLSELDLRPRQVLVEATILRATLTDDNSLGVDFTLLGGVDLEVLGAQSTGITTLETGQLPQERLGLFNAAAVSDFNGAVPQGGVTVGIIKDHVGVFVRALEQVTDTVLLANPKVLCLNKQKGQVIVGRRDGYITTTVTETQAIQSVEFLETGTQLIFRPFVGRDGYVRMELHPEDSIGGLTAANLPFETTTEVTTNVQVRDGQTILIGGLFREVTTNTRNQIPLLGDIPVLGQAFGSTRDTTQTEEVIILLTVHVVKDENLYAEQSSRQRDDFERMRVGLRRGLMWHGRERLAQAHYRIALKKHAEGDDAAALWHARLALRNEPRLTAAIELREELLEEREWDEPASVTDDFLYRLITSDLGVDATRFNRPQPPSREAGELPPAGIPRGPAEPPAGAASNGVSIREESLRQQPAVP